MNIIKFSIYIYYISVVKVVLYMEKVFIIGAGVAGLSAGIFARYHGFDVEILEKNNKPGGLCTGVVKDNYYYDNCLNYLLGTNKKTNLYKMWNKLGGFKDIKIVYNEYLNGYFKGGEKLIIYRDKEKFKKNMLSISIVDKYAIEEFFYVLDKFIQYGESICDIKFYKNIFTLKSFELYKYIDKLRKVSLEEYLCNFKSDIIRKTLSSLLPKGDTAISLFYLLSNYFNYNLGYPEGGSLKFALRLEKRFKELGGKIKYNCSVDEIYVSNKNIQRLKVNGGNIIKCNCIISAVDCKILLNKFLKKKYRDCILDYQYKFESRYPIYSGITIQIGVKCNMSNYFSTMIYDVEPFDIDKNIIDSLLVNIQSNNNIYTDEGKSVIKINILGDYYDYFKVLHGNSVDAYNNEIANIMDNIINRIISIYPRVEDNIEGYNIITPIDYEYKYGAYRGAYKSFMRNRNSNVIYHKGRIEGINKLYVAGQWTMMPGGVHLAALSGKLAVERLCKDCKIKFSL